MLEQKKAVIFDLDGTLVDSMWMWRDIDIEFLSERGIAMPETLQSEIEGISFSETAEYFKKRFSLPESTEQLMQIWNEMAHDKYCYEISLKPGAKLFLDFLKARGIKIGIGTSNSYELTTAALKAHGLSEEIDCIMTAREVPNGKPKPDIYLKTAETLGVFPKECLVFEDIPNGILAAKAAGMEVCAVEDLFSQDMLEKKRELADYYISSYEQVIHNTYEDLR